MKPDIGTESRFLPTHVHSTLALSLGGGVSSEYCYNVWYGKIKIVWLFEGEKNEDMFIRVDRMYERDRNTACIMSSSTHTRSTASNLEQVANLLCTQANSASYPQRDGK